jgi:transcriptional regulator with XRE-family HTH domain
MNKPLHQILARRIDESGLTQREIASALGYNRSNLVAMIKSGKMRIPISKIPNLADVLGIDRVELMRRALAEYQPEVLETLNQMLQEVVSESERRLLGELRKMINGPVPPLATAKQREQLKRLAAALVEMPETIKPHPRPSYGGEWTDPEPDTKSDSVETRRSSRRRT